MVFNARLGHYRQLPVAFQRVLQMEPDDGLLLPVLQPEIPGNPAVVLVHLSLAFSPTVEFAGRDGEPFNEVSGADLGLLRLAPDEIQDPVRLANRVLHRMRCNKEGIL
jgi:hypothetical protein